MWQSDGAIGLALRLFSREGLTRLMDAAQDRASPPPAVRAFLKKREAYRATIDAAVSFLQGRAPELAARICTRMYLPEGVRFGVLEAMQIARRGDDPLAGDFGWVGVQDRAKYLASLFIDDVADFIRDGVDSRFELSRYGEKLAVSASSFAPMRAAVDGPPSPVDAELDAWAMTCSADSVPDLVGITVPFPGNLYAGLRVARRLKERWPGVKVVMGGGYVNTELRSLSEPLLFDDVDFVTLDDGERPLLCLLEYLAGKRAITALCRTFVREAGAVVLMNGCPEPDVCRADVPAPSYKGLSFDQYISLCEMPNSMHRLWTDGRWNKLMLAHGCYWHRCSFCDTTLDYIGRYDADEPSRLVDRMEAVIGETGCRGFHFVDEAAPPALLKGLATEIVRRGLSCAWWTNIRFEKAFSPVLARLMMEAGCVAVSGGLEVAGDRLLERMEKGITVAQAARVTHAFASAGIQVHAYLMYGFPSQTVQETVDALEIVRQLFAAGCIQSAYWHRFALTVHSRIAADPAAHGIRIQPVEAKSFAVNEIPFRDAVGTDHDTLGEGLRAALYNYMHGVCMEDDVRRWFKVKAAKSRIHKDHIASLLSRI